MSSKPKPKIKPDATTSPQDLVKVGPREVFIDADKAQKLRDVKPTTSRALVLRGKYTVQGVGESAFMSRITGREKLDLLAADLVEQTEKAVAAPFDIQKCLRIAEVQYDACLGEIGHLHDNEMFSNIILAELEAHARYDPKRPDPMKNPTYVARTIGTRIHNEYMNASAWKIVKSILHELVNRGMSSKNVKALLKNDMRLRGLYMALMRMVELMVDINQQRFSTLALNSAHYARYFKQQPSDDPSDDPEIIFDHSELREAALSFIDSIIIELCFPRAPYPKFVLYQLLHDAAEESPRDTKRFSQLMWDAVGDLSECVEMHQLLEIPLISSEGREWKEGHWQMPQEFDHWRDAQMLSLKASEEIGNFKDVVFPLTKTIRKAVLDSMWIRIDQNYFKITGQDIDDLWGLKGEHEITPQWTSYYVRAPRNMYDSDDSDDDDNRRNRLDKKSKKPLAIADYAAQDKGYDSMPELQTVSNSPDESGTEDDVSQVDYVDSDSDQSGYNTEEEEEIKLLMKEAVNYAIEKDLFEAEGCQTGPAKLGEDRLINPFLNLLESLRGRLFKKSPRLKVRHGPARSKTKPAQRGGKTPPSQKAIVEEVTDEEEPASSAKKKRKKPKKKKKLASIATEEQVPASPTSPVAEREPVISPPDSPIPKITPPGSPKAKKIPTTPAGKAKPAAAIASVASLPTFETTTNYGQSARTYLSSFEPQKAKPKTRTDQASVLSKEEEKQSKGIGIGGSIMSKLGFGKKKPEMEEKEQRTARKSWFQKLGSKTTAGLHHLFRTADDLKQGKGGMRWDDFVKIMTDMGFSYDPSTAGSSVRFTPPGADDHPITFHKPHPKPYIDAWKLRGYAKRLKNHYGWSEELLRDRIDIFDLED